MTLSNVGVAYRQRHGLFGSVQAWALRGVNLEVLQGETLGVVGRNGAGKSSLLRVLARIATPSEGEMTTYSDFISLLSLDLGFVPNLSGLKNIHISGMLYGLSRPAIEEMTPAIVDYSELGTAIYKPVRTYSAGMKARLGFSVATVVDPDILLIDEVLGVGDLAFRKKSSATMRNRLKSAKTAIFVSHSIREVNALCDRVVWLEENGIKMVGDPRDVTEAYEHCLITGAEGPAQPLRHHD